MASDYSEYQGSDYYHLTKPPKQNNLVDGLNAALQTFIAIRSGKAQMDRQEKDRATKEKYTGEDRAMAKEKHQADMNESSAKKNLLDTQSRLYGMAKEQPDEKKQLTLQQVELAKAKIASLKPGDPHYDANVAKILAEAGLTNAKSRGEDADTAQTQAETGGTMPAKQNTPEDKVLKESQAALNRAKVTIDPKTGLPTLARGKANPQALLKAVDSDLNWLSEQEMKVANSMKKNDMGEEVEDAGAMSRITNSKPYKDKLKMIYLNLKSASENLPEGEKLSAAHQDVFEALKSTFEGKLPTDPTKPATTEKGAVDPLKAGSNQPPASIIDLEKAKSKRLGLNDYGPRMQNVQPQSQFQDENKLVGNLTVESYFPKPNAKSPAPTTPYKNPEQRVGLSSDVVEAPNNLQRLLGNAGDFISKKAKAVGQSISDRSEVFGAMSQKVNQAVRLQPGVEKLVKQDLPDGESQKIMNILSYPEGNKKGIKELYDMIDNKTLSNTKLTDKGRQFVIDAYNKFLAEELPEDYQAQKIDMPETRSFRDVLLGDAPDPAQKTDGYHEPYDPRKYPSSKYPAREKRFPYRTIDATGLERRK